MATALPNPSGFRTITLPFEAPVKLFAARLVHERIDFNYSFFDGQHQFVFPARHYRQVMELQRQLQ